jgi:hypothetical protein
MFGLFKKLFWKKPPPEEAGRSRDGFPPVPKWRPPFEQPLEAVVERVGYYTKREWDFVVFCHGTCVVLPENHLPDDRASATAREILDKVYRFHPDFGSAVMDDGNILIEYNHPVLNVVLQGFADEHWDEIERNHQDALTPSEVLITSLGPNRFNDADKTALFGGRVLSA